MILRSERESWTPVTHFMKKSLRYFYSLFRSRFSFLFVLHEFRVLNSRYYTQFTRQPKQVASHWHNTGENSLEIELSTIEN